MGWFSLAKIALQAGSKIYANRQKTKMAMSDAQLMHAEKMARGEEAYQGKLLEARQSDWKDEFVLIILSAPIIVLAWAVLSDDPAAMENERRKTADQAKAELDRAKLVQARDIVDEKMEQNEKLAKLRAGVSLAKADKPGITAIEVEE